METTPAVDFVSLVRSLVGIRGSRLRALIVGHDWGPDEENRALLVDVAMHGAQLEWTDRITDPDDQDLKRERLEAKRKGVRPPPQPLIQPVGCRPDDVAEQRWQQYIEQATKARQPEQLPTPTLDEFDQAMGIVAEHAGRG